MVWVGHVEVGSYASRADGTADRGHDGFYTPCYTLEGQIWYGNDGFIECVIVNTCGDSMPQARARWHPCPPRPAERIDYNQVDAH